MGRGRGKAGAVSRLEPPRPGVRRREAVRAGAPAL